MKLNGLIAATYTPFDQHGKGERVGNQPDGGISAGESNRRDLRLRQHTAGMSLSTDERKAVADGYVKAVKGRVPVVIQVGHNSLAESCSLAAHAASIGADAVSATCPSYFKITDLKT